MPDSLLVCAIIQLITSVIQFKLLLRFLRKNFTQYFSGLLYTHKIIRYLFNLLPRLECHRYHRRHPTKAELNSFSHELQILRFTI